MRNLITNAIKEVSGIDAPIVEIPGNIEFGDYTTNVALLDKRPRENAQELVEKLKAHKNLSKICDKIEVAGPGFINFWLKSDILVSNLTQIDAETKNYGKSVKGKGQTVVIDYSSPNIAKPFGIGHLRSTLIGQALYNLYQFLGYEVVGDNHLGDWGTQFGKLIYMIKTQNSTDYSIQNLETLYVQFHKLAEDNPKLEEEARKWFKKLEDGDLETKEIWKKCVDVSMTEFDRIYKILGVKIDFAFGESYYLSEMKQMISGVAFKKHLTKGEKGALVIDLTKFGIKTPLMVLKNDGASTYATRDLATIKFRERKWDPAIIIYEVGAEQKLHFEQVIAAAKLLGIVNPSVKMHHTAHGLYLAPDGKKFSTRKGKTIKLEEVLDEAIKRAMELGQKSSEPAYAKATATAVGIGAIKYFDLMHAVASNVIFDWEKIMNLEGNSGPYLQYTIARCNSVLNKANPQIFKSANELEIDELSVLRSLIHFSEVIESAANLYSPNLLCNYLFDLAQKYNHLYNSIKIIGSDNENFRLTLTNGVGQVLKNGLNILGIQTPERM